MTNPKKETVTTGKVPWTKISVAIILLAIITTTFLVFRDDLRLENLAKRESELRAFQRSQPALVYAIAFAAYVAVTGLSLPGASAMTLLLGWYFGLVRALILISFASTTGATIAFLLSRYLFRDAVQKRFGDYLTRFNAALEREGAFYLFTLRLMAFVPFFVINPVMGLTPIRVSTYWWVSQLGMLPGTCVYVYAGSAVPNLQTLAEKGIHALLSPVQLWQLLFAFGLLGVFPIAVKKLVERFRPAPREQTGQG